MDKQKKTAIVHEVKLIEAGDMVVHAQKHRQGGFEPDSISLWKQYKGNGVMLDIGAYTGIYGLSAAVQGHNVIAFEPNPATFKRIRENMRVNNVDFPIYNVALWKEKCRKTLVMTNGWMTSAANLFSNDGKQKTEIQCLPLDDFYDKIPNVGFIKIDAERSESAILEGAKRIIKRDSPKILMEQLKGELEANQILQDWGYSRRKLSQNMEFWEKC